MPSRRTVLIIVGGLAALALLVLLVEPIRAAAGDAIRGDTEALREDLRALGAGGVLVVLVLAVLHSVIFYPAEILNAAAGFVYGFWWALLLVMTGWMINALICHQVGRYAARPLLYRLLGEDRFTRVERLVERGGVTLLLVVRVIPIVPFSLFCYVAGSTGVPLWTFTWTTFVGYIPITALFVYLGANLEELSPTDPILIGGGLALVAAIWIGHRMVRAHDRREAEEAEAAKAEETADSATAGDAGREPDREPA